MSDPIECKSRDGMTIGLIDSLITIADVLHERIRNEQARLKRSKDEFAWHSQPVQDALHDLRLNKSLRDLLYPRDAKVMEILERAASSMEKAKNAASKEKP